jgi:hypothetical protein
MVNLNLRIIVIIFSLRDYIEIGSVSVSMKFRLKNEYGTFITRSADFQ